MAEDPRQSGPLAGVRVVDLTQTLAGPYCTMLLADLGADVIKVESSEHPDNSRSVPTVEIDGQTVYFSCLNRNKRSVELDLKADSDHAAFLRLVASADVVVENFAPGVMDRLGASFEQLRAVNPRIVMCSISGFGPDTDGPAYDYLVQALVGTMSLTGEPDGPPTKYGVSVVDHMGGAFGVIGILAALREAERSGEGRHVDIALFDTHLSMLSYIAADYLNGGALPVRLASSAHPYAVPSQLFETSDGHVVIMPLANHMWKKLCGALALTEPRGRRLARLLAWPPRAARARDRGGGGGDRCAVHHRGAGAARRLRGARPPRSRACRRCSPASRWRRATCWSRPAG